MADEAKAHSIAHQTWIMEALKGAEGNALSYDALVKIGEEKHCDTLGALLKVMKGRKAIAFDQMFLMYPMHKDEIVRLVNPDYDPAAQ
mmetsp:Transcript_41233/g.127336  ORF Transcript_41233/g.127336 Transcript_41233/m.127336 type:complete len:88 (-) Transcript_41233:29-292(-)|eukprot:CAMPEP_0174827932 /NCGR_PEP_ID=MMETSP1114-20130205/1025_1 /TAXON_ID=312471 /ORGANISM="Neobodo designis, Strain CCAP 1951/1" /LENGTH=87 /DNA_ID=CAMNT_0016061619 /DNA_START=33 /DNA_END=296 /DNA_ORIENTATION=+